MHSATGCGPLLPTSHAHTAATKIATYPTPRAPADDRTGARFARGDVTFLMIDLDGERALARTSVHSSVDRGTAD